MGKCLPKVENNNNNSNNNNKITRAQRKAFPAQVV